MKTTLNPFENAKRTAQGAGGASPAIIEEMQAQISVLGSENATQAQDITDIKAQLTELAGAYSTTEHKTGRKWLDGKDIYEKTIALDVTGLTGNQSYEVLDDVSMFSTFVNSGLVVKSAIDVGFDHSLLYMNVTENKLYVRPVGTWNNITSANLIIEYTKTGE